MNYRDWEKGIPETIKGDSLWNVTQHRSGLLVEIIRLLLTMIPQQRGRILREEGMPYRIAPEANELDDLLTKVPLPPV